MPTAQPNHWGWRSASLTDVLRARATTQAGAPAFVFLENGERESDRLSFAELDLRARVIAAALQRVARPGDRALLLYPQGVEFIAAFFGCLYAGLVAVPTKAPGANRKSARLDTILADADAIVALTTRGVVDRARLHISERPGRAALQWICSDDLPLELAASWQPVPIAADRLALIQYTSGSTSTPKGVMITHGNLVHNALEGALAWGDSTDNVMLTWVPTFHDLGLIYGVTYPVFSGMTCYMMAPVAFLAKPFRWLDAMSRYRATHTAAPNFAFDLCIDRITPEQRAQLDLRPWSVTLNAAEPVRASTVARFTELFGPCGFNPTTMCPGFGLAEVTMRVTCSRPNVLPLVIHVDPDALGRGRIVERTDGSGVPLVGCGPTETDTRLAIVDPETAIPRAEDEIGEVWVSSRSNAAGYWQRPDDTARTFQARLADSGDGPFLRTGDLGFVRGGELFITGRIKDLIIIRGQNHYPQDIELTVDTSHPALRRNWGAAFSVPVKGEERLVVVQEVERTALRTLSSAEIFAAIRQAVAEGHDLQVHGIVLVRPGTILKTSSGKIQRQATRRAYVEGQLDVVAEWRQALTEPAPLPTADTLRERLLAMLSRLLGIAAHEIDVRQPFARYGMDSLAATTLAAQLGDTLERTLPPTIAYDYPTVEQLVRHLTGDEGARATARDSRARAGSRDGRVVPGEPIAIVGLGCRFPGASTPDAFWALLRDGVDAITEVPSSRWDAAAIHDPEPGTSGRTNSRWGGFLDDIAAFDASFFGISSREAAQMDPQQRLLLEVGWEALEDAGLAPDRLAGSPTGVFVGISTSDYAGLQRAAGPLTLHSGTGQALSVAASRLAYALDLHGPALAIDTACSSSLVAVHTAVQSLRAGECDVALAGGVNAMLTPDLTIALSQARMLSSSGRCRAFDADADGYVRSEGCGLVVLKRLADAREAGDRILALIRGSAINQDGRSNGLTAPSGLAQQAVVRRALADAGLDPSAVSYVEAHGTGTRLGDPIEVRALVDVLGVGRSPDRPLWVGSVKTNIGHLESAAGIAGLIKVVLALRHREMPPHLHLRALNPQIAAMGAPIAVPTTRQAWDAEAGTAGVSSFGFSGTNAHVILQAAAETPVPPNDVDRPAHILALSAATDTALTALAARYVSHLRAHPDEDLGALCSTAYTGRAHLSTRAAIVCASRDTERLISALASIRLVHTSCAPRVAFVFADGAASAMGTPRELYETQPTFRDAMDRCAAAIGDRLSTAESTAFAIGYGLSVLWRSWGIEPVAVVGHGAGAYAVACAAGVFDVDSAVQLMRARSQPIEVRRDIAQAIHYERPRVPVLDGTTGAIADDDICSAEHWTRQTTDVALRAGAASSNGQGRSTVVASGTGLRDSLTSLNVTVCLDLASAWSSSSSSAAATAPDARDADTHGPIWLSSLRAGTSDWQQMLDTLGRLYELGAAIDWHGFDRDYARRRVALPTYPFERQHHWLDLPKPAAPRETPAKGGTAYAITWEEWPSPARRSTSTTGRWAIVAARASTARQVANWLATQGESATSIVPADGVTRSVAGVRRDEYARALRDIATHDALKGVLFCGALDAPPAQTTTSATELVEWASDTCADFVDLSAALASVADTTSGAADARLWGLTRGAVATGKETRLSPAQAPLWGLGRVIGVEQPAVWGGLVDLDPSAADGAAARSAFDSPCSARGHEILAALAAAADGAGARRPAFDPAGCACGREILDAVAAAAEVDQIALRAGRLLCPRLTPRPMLGQVHPRRDATYLITGGTGGLGLTIASHLVRRGARTIVLVSRQAVETDAVSRALEPLRRAGASVHVVGADVAQRDALAGVLDWIGRELPPLRGVVHAAGVLDDGLLTAMGRERFAAVFHPKIAGAWHLHQLLADVPLDWFVLCSSMAGLVGSAGQANYAAANAFLDALADARTAAGLPAVAIDWGLWDGVGLTVRMSASHQERMAALGVSPLDRDDALRAFDGCLSESGQIGYACVDWATFAAAHPRHALTRPFRADDARPPAAPARGWLRDRLREADDHERRDVLLRAVQEEMGAVLRCEPHAIVPHRGFFDQGLDSLLSIELHQRLAAALGQTLPATLTLEHPTAEKLSQALLAAVRLDVHANGNGNGHDPRGAAAAEDPEIASAALEEVRSLSPRELEEAIDRELRSLP